MTPRLTITAPMNSILTHLAMNGFTVGLTNTGFAAIDDDGIVFICSKYRTSAQVTHPRTGHNRIDRIRVVPTKEWCDKRIVEFTAWTKEQNAKCPSRTLQVSKRPVPSQLVKKLK